MTQRTSSQAPVLVIGAGLAGLACAVRLHEAGRKVEVFDKSDEVGGRVRTATVDGFLLDRGFQVYLDAYPEAGQFLDLAALDLQSFDPGALVWRNGKIRRVMDVFRRPGALFSSALQPIGSIRDKLLVAKLRFYLRRKPIEEIWKSPEQTTGDYLRDFGFSESMIDLFFRGFYGGIFLEDLLITSSQMFEFTFKMFAEGSATLPSRGMQEIPRQLQARLPEKAVHLGCDVTSLDGTRISGKGVFRESSVVVLATDGSAASSLLPDITEPRWNSTACLYFSTENPPISDPIILLKGDREGLINNVSVPTNVSAHYGPPGLSLLSVSVLGDHRKTPDLEKSVQTELVSWFGESAKSWLPLHTFHVCKALPAITAGHNQLPPPAPEGIYVCGDTTTSGSIEGAILSGLRTADRILSDYPQS